MDFFEPTERVGVMDDYIRYRYKFNNVLITNYQGFEYNRLQLFAGYFYSQSYALCVMQEDKDYKNCKGYCNRVFSGHRSPILAIGQRLFE